MIVTANDQDHSILPPSLSFYWIKRRKVTLIMIGLFLLFSSLSTSLLVHSFLSYFVHSRYHWSLLSLFASVFVSCNSDLLFIQRNNLLKSQRNIQLTAASTFTCLSKLTRYPILPPECQLLQVALISRTLLLVSLSFSSSLVLSLSSLKHMKNV